MVVPTMSCGRPYRVTSINHQPYSGFVYRHDNSSWNLNSLLPAILLPLLSSCSHKNCAGGADTERESTVVRADRWPVGDCLRNDQEVLDERDRNKQARGCRRGAASAP